MKTRGHKTRLGSAGQSMVELGLMLPFLLILVGAVVDFGLAIFAGQIAEFASRDAARFAATVAPEDPETPEYPAAELGSCQLSGCASAASRVLQAAAARIPGVGLFESFSVTAVEEEIAGEDSVTVTVAGTYNWAFLWLIRIVPPMPLLGDAGFPQNLEIARSTTARWEWQ